MEFFGILKLWPFDKRERNNSNHKSSISFLISSKMKSDTKTTYPCQRGDYTIYTKGNIWIAKYNIGDEVILGVGIYKVL